MTYKKLATDHTDGNGSLLAHAVLPSHCACPKKVVKSTPAVLEKRSSGGVQLNIGSLGQESRERSSDCSGNDPFPSV